MTPTKPPPESAPTPDTEQQTTAAPSQATERGLRLLVMSEGHHGVHKLPARGGVVIGRGGDAEVRIKDPSVSRRHAQLALGPSITITDLGSSNGTTVRGTLLRANQTVSLERGEIARIGSVVVIVEEPAEPQPAVLEAPGEPRHQMDALAEIVARIAPTNLTVLLRGETGAGKEVLSERIHRSSKRAAMPLIKLNCAAIPETLLESELFGHEKGAFTGADHAKPGLLETAHGGTMFLDEIGELPPAAQVKLLRVLEERKVTRVGSVTPREIDVRFIAATNRPLEEDVARNAFRADLFFRLNGTTIAIPPLRDRVNEIESLAHHFVAEASRAVDRPAPVLAPDTLQRLVRYPWPGNVRELRNMMEHAVAICTGPTLLPEHLTVGDRPSVATIPPPFAPAEPVAAPPVSQGPMLERSQKEAERFERQEIVDALARANGNQTVAAELLGVSRRTLIRRLDQFGLGRPRKGRD